MDEKACNTSYQMGMCYYRGANGYPLDHDKAFRFISAAAKAGNDEAMHHLGVLYKNGEGTQQNFQLAIEWFCKAMQTNNENGFATFDLGRMYYFGTGVPKNFDAAFELFDRAIKLALGNTQRYYPSACHLAGCILLEKKNYKDACSYFSDAAKYGNYVDAWYNLGWLAEKGAMKDVTTGKPESVAFGFYKKAADLGHAPSMHAVGRIYLMIKENEQAIQWFEKAAAKGYEPAKKGLKMLKITQGGSLLDLFNV